VKPKAIISVLVKLLLWLVLLCSASTTLAFVTLPIDRFDRAAPVDKSLPPRKPLAQLRRFGPFDGAAILSSPLDDLPPSIDSPPVFFLTVGFLVVALLAQSFINDLTSGDDGLGAFLSDGTGYNRSGFKASTSRKNSKSKGGAGAPVSKDPMPWLRLPSLDFVEVAGQTTPDSGVDDEISLAAETEFLSRLETKTANIREALDAGEEERARVASKELEQMLEGSGYEYRTSGETASSRGIFVEKNDSSGIDDLEEGSWE